LSRNVKSADIFFLFAAVPLQYLRNCELGVGSSLDPASGFLPVQEIKRIFGHFSAPSPFELGLLVCLGVLAFAGLSLH
jgi:hypothetical protein